MTLRGLQDDLQNNWGYDLFHCEVDRRGSRDGTCSETKVECSRLLNIHARPFEVDNYTPSGTMANQRALELVTTGRVDRAIAGSGCYLSGDDGYLHMASSVHFTPQGQICLFKDPSQLPLDNASRNITVPLPYCIPVKGFRMDSHEVKSLENKCLEYIRRRCILAALKERPVKALILELILAGCGAVLSDRFLRELANLSRHHDFFIVVDEILTGGRCTSDFLVTKEKPKEFIDRVSHVTLGKWPKCGIVLRHRKIFPIPDDVVCRGNSTVFDLREAYAMAKRLFQLNGNIAARRAQTLQKIKVQEEESWGQGCLIFCCRVHSSSQRAIKCRYLPLLDDRKFTPCIKFLDNKNLTIPIIQQRLWEDVLRWAPERDFIASEQEHQIVSYLLDRAKECTQNFNPEVDTCIFVHRKTMVDVTFLRSKKIDGHSLKKHVFHNVLERLVACRLLEEKVKGKKGRVDTSSVVPYII